MLKIYDTNHNAIGHIVKYKDLKIESDVTTGDQALSFTYMARHHEICEEYYIETQDAEYVVKEKSVSTDGFLSFVAVLNLEELEAKPWSSFSITDSTIEDAAKLALAGSGWTVGKCTVAKKRNAGILQTNTLGVIQKLCTAFMCEVVYDTKKKTVSFYNQVGQDKGNFFLTGLNLKRLQRKGSTYDYYTRIIPIGQDGLTIESVNDGKNYLENYQYTNKVKAYIWKDESYTDAAALKEDAEAKLKDLSKPEVSYSADIIDMARQRAGYDDFSFSLGDTITLIDAATGIREKQRIIKLIQYPQNHTKDECELANKLPSFEETREKLQAAQEIINTVISDDGRYTGTINVSDILHFNEGVSGSSAVGALQGQYNTLAGSLSELKISVGQIEANYIRAEEADIKYATIESLKALEIETASIKSKYAKFESTVTDELAANKALINELDVKKLNATAADLKYANIDFSNIGTAAMEKFYSESGLIKNVVVGNQNITGELVGVTIKGDLIEGNTLKADKLVIKGKDGLYYKLNTDGTGVTSEQTDENSLNGTVIQAKSITADKVAVTDLVAFGADIGGNHIGHDCIYSGAKTSALNTTRGFYLGSDGQVGFGDTNEYIQFYKGDDGAFHLRISAGDIVFGKSKQTIESAINNIDTKINNVKSIIDTIYTYQVGTNMTDTPTGEWLSAMPNVPQGQYLWTKETTLYSDGTTSVGYIATRMGVDGAGGAKGDTGPQGPKGEKGDKGDTGSRGPQGNQGVPGEKGEIGPQGIQGPQGVKGDKGATGPQGPQGNQGVPGVKGDKGDKGDTGAIGPIGPQGVKGDTGKQGIQGPQGVKGDKGATGATGPQGPQGNQGVPGAKGDTGPQGPQGVKGDGLDVKDTRNTNESPIWYIQNYPRTTVNEFKQADVLGISGEFFCILTTYVPWGDSSGGYPKQTVKIANKELWRVGIDDKSWGNWNDAYSLANFADMGIANWCYNNDRTYINGGKLYAGTVTAVQIAANAVTSEKIEAGAISTDKLAANAVTAAKINVADLFAQDITASGTIRGVTLVSADIIAKRIIATKEFSLSTSSADVERVLYYDGKSVRVGKLLNAASAQNGAGFEFFPTTITAYGNLNMYSGDITTPGSITATKTITANGSISAGTFYTSNWFRSYGQTGWFNETYGGGIWMCDSDWVRVYNNKGFAVNNNIYCGNGEYFNNKGNRDWQFGSACGTGDQNWFGFYDSTSGYHGGIYGPDHILRMNGEIQSMYPNAFRAIYGSYGFIMRNDGANFYFMPTNANDAYGGWNDNYSYVNLATGQWTLKDDRGHRLYPVLTATTYDYRITSIQKSGNNLRFNSLDGVARYCTGTTSDIRLKKNIHDVEVKDALSVINSIQLRSFDWKESGEHQRIGFVADELEQLDPKFAVGGGVTEDGGIDTKVVDTFYLLGYVVKAMQELSSEVKQLKKENEKLKRKLYS